MKPEIEYCDCNVGITNAFREGNCIKCKKKVKKIKPYYWQVEKNDSFITKTNNEKL